MLNKEIFVEDPTKKSIPNLGVAKVGEPTDDAGWAVLEYELKSFVCEGAYAQGLDRILSSYVGQAGSSQPAAWVSGFYGSGKSHLVRVLEYLWRDLELADGSTARGLVRTPQPVTDVLRELSTIGSRNGGLWSAAGTLGAGAGSVRLGFLSIILGAAGLPTDLAPARCVMWLQDEGLFETVQADIANRGLDWEMVLENMYVSELGEAILAAKPGWAASPDMAREQIHNQFPQPEDISLSETIKTVEHVLRQVSDTVGKLPCALVVLDEMQQFINEDPDRAQQVQLLVEACSSGFDGLLMIVATGQAALQTTAVLQKLIDRFAIQVQLSDTDVDAVIREVVLRKRPESVPALELVLEKQAGEIDRQLGGAVIAPSASDEKYLIPDYPLLPSRRRFWEHVLRSVDKAGKAGQLRSQLRVVHEASRVVADSPVGTVVPADFIYDEKSADMLQTGVLLREIEQLIKGERSQGPEGELRSRVLALVFLISQLSREGFADTGVRATEQHIADLLVDDLSGAGPRLRAEVPKVLEQLHAESKLLKVDEEYFLQTQAGQEWAKDFRNRRASFLSDSTRVSHARDSAFRDAMTRVVPRSRQHGLSKTPRNVENSFSDVEPKVDVSIPVWVRTGWDLAEKQFTDLASSGSTDSPLIFVYLPKVDADALAGALADLAAAEETLATRPRPNTDEGVSALKAMESTREMARQKVAGHVSDVLRQSTVAQSGGNRIAESDLSKALATAADRSIDRLYPKFREGDHTGWATVWARAVEGNENCLEAVNHKGPTASHPVCKAILSAVGPAGTSGNDLRKKFESPEYGWPRDAVHAGLAALVLATELNAEENGLPVSARQLKPNAIGKLIFRRETKVVPLGVRLAVQQVLTESGIAVERNEEAAACGLLLQRLSDLAGAAGGAPPLPAPPSTEFLDPLKGLKGNELISSVHDHREAIRTAVVEWRTASTLKQDRLANFSKAQRLVAHLPGDGEHIADQLRSVQDNRQLLQSPDPVAPIILAAAEVLRTALNAQLSRYNQAVAEALAHLAGDDSWGAMSGGQQEELLSKYELALVVTPALGTADQVLAALESRPVSSWNDRIDAVDAQLGRLREAAARLLEPTAFKIIPPNATLKSELEVEEYIDRLRNQMLDELQQHKSLIV
ncbi:BREX system P-loop protein BrxC [Pseudarthrobacter sp. BIM B-2242]|uniref:BREX system P-loop protein BrxC n=1 Tax=Pseudarthrobacter sp. BIM B-2242 TaxID=2772401 RepID=UPI001CC82394|nr:BREX system P-loop protein BrxC [Pseudarthrobacter sp. BIM B-2242]